MTMSNNIWPNYIKQTLFAARITEWDQSTEGREQPLAAFVERWGSLDVDAFKRALVEGNAVDRLFAIFALGVLAPSDMEAFLQPFLHSSLRKERWASAIVLGQYKNEQAISLLLVSLPERLACTPFFPSFAEEARVDAETSEQASDTEWFFLQRNDIVLMLGTSEDTRAIAVLTQTFQIYYAEDWHDFDQVYGPGKWRLCQYCREDEYYMG